MFKLFGFHFFHFKIGLSTKSWSPEGIFYCTVVWLNYLLLFRSSSCFSGVGGFEVALDQVSNEAKAFLFKHMHQDAPPPLEFIHEWSVEIDAAARGELKTGPQCAGMAFKDILSLVPDHLHWPE